MIPREDVISIHNLLIERFGGIKGIRDKNALDSALNRPYRLLKVKIFILQSLKNWLL